MNRSGQMVLGEFAFLANIDQNELLATIHSCFDFVHVCFANALLGIVHNVEKSWGMLRGHGLLRPKEQVRSGFDNSKPLIFALF
jgi:hypothetical protein